MAKAGVWMWNPDKTAKSMWPEEKVEQFKSYGWTLAPAPIFHGNDPYSDISVKVISYPPNNYDGYSTCYYDILRSLKYGGLSHAENKDADVLFYYRQPLQGETLNTYKPTLMYTMLETEKLPGWWIPILKEADMLIVPSKAVQKVFEQYGLKTHVVHHGVDHQLFRKKKRVHDGVVKFLHLNAFGDNRKGWKQILEAWEKAGLHKRQDVSLTLKTVYPQIPELPNWKNLTVIKKKLEREQIRDLYYDHDCFVFPSWGEGFGLPPVEAMATGMPCITVDATGMHEYVHDSMYIAKHTEPGPKADSYSHFPDQDLGHFHCLVDVDSLAEQITLVADNPEEAFERGIESARFIHKNFTYKQYGKGLGKAMNALLKKEEDIAIFSPSKSGYCGIWKYSEYLGNVMNWRIYPTTSALQQMDPKTVFAQHHYGIYNRPTLETLLAMMKQGTNVVITVHAWQRHAQNELLVEFPLVVHSEYMKEIIIQEYPETNIAVIPHGCIEPVKNEYKQGTLGAFGMETANKRFYLVEEIAEKYGLESVIMKSRPNGTYYKESEVLEKMSQCEYVTSMAGDDGMVEHSGSLRFLLASGRPVILSDAERHKDIPENCYMKSIDDGNEEEVIKNAREYCEKTSWKNVGQMYKNIVK